MTLAPEDEVRSVLDSNPRYVFFKAENINDPAEGPKGSAQTPLLAGTSVAVDPRFNSLGAVFIIAPEGAGAPPAQLSVAQDTGGAIKGPLRADLFFGTGEDIGRQASLIKHRARWWALYPRSAEK